MAPSPETASSPTPARGAGPGKLVGLGALYFAQGIPLGIAAEYLPVVLRQSHASYSTIAAVSWLQLPWTLKVLWARAGDAPALRRHARAVVLGLQVLLAVTIASYTFRSLAEARWLWFTLTATCALFASTQDVFVDGLASRTLSKEERGLGNVAQVGAYRLGMVAGGAGLLTLGGLLGERGALVALSALTLFACLGVLGVGEPNPVSSSTTGERKPSGTLRDELREALAAFRAMATPKVRAVLVVAFTFKLGLHAAAALLKPVLVDAGWSKERIGALAVTVGTLAGVLGSLVGGLVHRKLGDRRGLLLAGALQALACAPLVLLVGHAHRTGWVTTALAAEHAASGLGTTVLFAALMGATDKKHAALQFTVLSTANALSLAVAGGIAGALADLVHARAVFVLGALGSLAALAAVNGFEKAAHALRDDPHDPHETDSTALR